VKQHRNPSFYGPIELLDRSSHVIPQAGEIASLSNRDCYSERSGRTHGVRRHMERKYVGLALQGSGQDVASHSHIELHRPVFVGIVQ
jgi:hypothetical protein